MTELGEDHLWHSISQGVREARRAHGLKHLPATGGIASVEDVPGEEFLGQETAEEDLTAPNPGPDGPQPHRPEPT
jgi:sulfate permease, SulP family